MSITYSKVAPISPKLSKISRLFCWPPQTIYRTNSACWNRKNQTGKPVETSRLTYPYRIFYWPNIWRDYTSFRMRFLRKKLAFPQTWYEQFEFRQLLCDVRQFKFDDPTVFTSKKKTDQYPPNIQWERDWNQTRCQKIQDLHNSVERQKRVE